MQVTLNTAAARATGSSAQPGSDAQPAAAESLPAAVAMVAPRVRTLLDYVAWLSAPSTSNGTRPQPLSEELSAVEQAAARMQVQQHFLTALVQSTWQGRPAPASCWQNYW
jgi:hypothetical protein